MIIVNTHEAKTKLSFLLKLIETQHETVRICRNGEPVADIVPIQIKKNPLAQHPILKDVSVSYDVTSPVDENDWPEDTR